MNISDITIPNQVQEVSNLGPKYCIPVEKQNLPIHHIIANIEAGIDKFDNDTQTEIRNSLNNSKKRDTKLNKEKITIKSQDQENKIIPQK